MKVLKKLIILFSCFILVFSIFFTSYEKTEAAAQKVITKVVSLSAKRALKDAVIEKAQHTVQQKVVNGVSSEIAEKYVKKEGFELIQDASNKKLYHIKKVIEPEEEKKLAEVIELNIEKRISGGRKFNLFENIMDFFFDYKLILGGIAYLDILLSGRSQQELNELTFESLVGAGLLVPAVETTASNTFYDPVTFNDYDIYDSSTYEGSDIILSSNPGDYNYIGYTWRMNDLIFGDFNGVLGNTISMDFVNVVEGSNFFFNFEEKYKNYMFGMGIQYAGMMNGVNAVVFYFSQISGIEIDMGYQAFYNGELIKTAVNFEPIDNELVYQVYKNIKQFTIYFPKGTYNDLVLEMTDGVNVVRIFHKVFDVASDFNLASVNAEYSNYEVEDMGQMEQPLIEYEYFNTKRLIHPLRPEPNIEEITIDDETSVKIPNITEIPLINEVTGEPLKIERKEGSPIDNPEIDIVDTVGNPVPDSTEITVPDVGINPNPGGETVIIEEPYAPAEPNPSPGEGVPGGGGDTPSKNWKNKLKTIVTTKFPFSLPWDFYAMLKFLDSDPVTPHFKVNADFAGMPIEIDQKLDYFDPYIRFFRAFIVIGFCISLILLTRRLMGGSV